MDVQKALSPLRAQLAAVNAAIAALEKIAGGQPSGKRRGRPPGSKNRAPGAGDDDGGRGVAWSRETPIYFPIRLNAQRGFQASVQSNCSRQTVMT